MTFNPKDHMTQIKTKQGPKDYLPVMARMAWFRDKYPSGSILTEFVQFGETIVGRASIVVDDVVIAMGSAGVRAASGYEVWAGRDIEKAETAAIGRALAAAGFGTLQTGEEFEEGDYLADSPVEPRKQAAGWTTVEITEFVRKYREDGIKDAEVLAALKVAGLREWTGSLKQAQTALDNWLKEQLDSSTNNTAPGYDKQAVYEAVKTLYKGVFPHFVNSLTSLAAEGKVLASMTTAQVIEVIKAHKAQPV